jgi:hypothetical protein
VHHAKAERGRPGPKNRWERGRGRGCLAGMPKLRTLLALSLVLACGGAAETPKQAPLRDQDGDRARARRRRHAGDALPRRSRSASRRSGPEDKAGPGRIVAEVGPEPARASPTSAQGRAPAGERQLAAGHAVRGERRRCARRSRSTARSWLAAARRDRRRHRVLAIALADRQAVRGGPAPSRRRSSPDDAG